MDGEPLVILLVEDNPDHTELIKRSFENHLVANHIYHVSDGESALNYLFRRNEFADPSLSPPPHVILLDLRLPRIDGLQVLKEIKSHETTRHIPVVVITTSEAEQDIVRAYDHHANSYLVKPVDFEQFTQMMRNLGFYWLFWNRYPWS